MLFAVTHPQREIAGRWLAAAFTGVSVLAFCGGLRAQGTTAPVAVPPDAQAAVSATPQVQDTGATAAASQPNAVAEIVVTAQRRQERVTDVPISITVASQAQLERQQVNTVNDLNRIAPSLEIQSAPGQNTGGGGAIRGIGTQTFSAGAVASVGLVVDQVSQGNANISDLFDVSRVEVLKGPQGTLFGLTTSAGVINITTNAPDPSHVSARLRTELSDDGVAGSRFGDQIVQGVVNLPLGPTAALRVSGVANLRQGVDRNAYTGDDDDTDRYGGRARLLWRATDRVAVNLIGDYTRGRFDGGGDFFTFVKAAGPEAFFGGAGFDPVGITARLASCGVAVGAGDREYCTRQSITGHNTNFGASAQVDFDAGPVVLTSITSYRGSDEGGAGAAGDVFRADPLELQVANGNVDRNLHLLTEELRLSSPANHFLEYTVGAFYSHQEQTREPEAVSVTLNPAPNIFIPIVRSLGGHDSILDESAAVFGQGTLHVTEALRLIAGARYTNADLSLNRYDLDVPTDPIRREKLDVDKISYRFGAQYDLMARTMIYATASRGFKGGQIAEPTAPQAPYVVQPEIPTAYELGLKSTLFGGWVADLNVFDENIKNFQSQECTVDANAVISCVQTNINGVKSRGAELDFFGRVFEGFSLNTGFIYAKATYPNNFIGTDGTNIGGTQLPYAPEEKFTLSGEYEHEVRNDVKGFVALDTVWKSRLRYEANSRAETTYPAHWMVGARVGVRASDDRYSAAIFVRNLFDEHEPSLLQSDFPYNGTADVGAIYGPQSFRQVGISIDGRF